MRPKNILVLTGLIVASVASSATAAEPHQFRGPNRDGHFEEEGLLTAWPEKGPRLLWQVEGLGESYASVSIGDGRIYTTMKRDSEAWALAIDSGGEVLWKTHYGSEHSGNGYPGSRTTPTFVDGVIYVLSSAGEAAALKAEDGELLWKVDLFERYGGKNIRFGVAESPLVDGDRVIFTAGGKDASVVALDRKTGDEVWTSKGLSDGAAYCSPVLLENARHRQIVTLLSGHLVGLDPETGAVLWKQPAKVQYDIHAVSPAIQGNTIYISHGYKQGGRAYELAADGRSVEEIWTEDDLDVHHGGVVLHGGKIFGAASNGTWSRLNLGTGEVEAQIRRLGKGAIVVAEDLLYGYTEKGEMHLVDPESMEVVSTFEVKQGTGQHWSHPVIAGGVLYLRHGDVLLAYELRPGS